MLSSVMDVLMPELCEVSLSGGQTVPHMRLVKLGAGRWQVQHRLLYLCKPAELLKRDLDPERLVLASSI